MVDPGQRARVAMVFRSAAARGNDSGRPVELAVELSPRLLPMAEALAAADVTVIPVPYAEGREDETATALADVDAALVWADPLSDEGDRRGLDQVLRHAAGTGIWVSAHPDVVDRLGTKDVLVSTRHLSWGSDVHLYRTVEQLYAELPARLAADGVRVLKASRGNGGRTVWKVRLLGGAAPVVPDPDDQGQVVVVQHAKVRDTSTESMSLPELLGDCAATFESWAGAALVDQEFVPAIVGGIVRCYLVGGEVVGFARQYPEGVVPDGPLQVAPGSGPAPGVVMGLPSPKTMYPPDEPALGALRERLEQEWVPGLLSAVGLGAVDLPALWDIDLIADALHEPEPRFVLCEINASSVIPFPPEAPARVAQYVVTRLVSQDVWRWRRDLNPRWTCAHKRFRGVLLRPLGHATAGEATRGVGGRRNPPARRCTRRRAPRRRPPGGG